MDINGYKPIHLMESHGGNSNVFLKQGDKEGEKILRKEYPHFSPEEIKLYHEIHSFLSKYERVFNKNPDEDLILDNTVIEQVKVRILPLDPENIVIEDPLIPEITYVPQVTVTYPEYIHGNNMDHYLEQIMRKVGRFAQSIERLLLEKLGLFGVMISPQNTKTSIEGSILHLTVTDIAKDMHDFFRPMNFVHNESILKKALEGSKVALFKNFKDIEPIVL